MASYISDPHLYNIYTNGMTGCQVLFELFLSGWYKIDSGYTCKSTEHYWMWLLYYLHFEV